MKLWQNGKAIPVNEAQTQFNFALANYRAAIMNGERGRIATARRMAYQAYAICATARIAEKFINKF